MICMSIAELVVCHSLYVVQHDSYKLALLGHCGGDIVVMVLSVSSPCRSASSEIDAETETSGCGKSR
jgi:hypothetical protein